MAHAYNFHYFERYYAACGYGVGCELVGIEQISHSRRVNVLRVHIDNLDGITLHDCVVASNQFGGILDIEGHIMDRYVLECSSPGLYGPLFTEECYERYRGKIIRVRLRNKLDGQKRFISMLSGVDGDCVSVIHEGKRLRLPFSQIASAQLVPEL